MQRQVLMSETAQNVLNTILYHTGEQNNSFMLVLATNRPYELDEALLDRMDEVLHIPLPELKERQNLCHLYYRCCLSERVLPSNRILPAFGIYIHWCINAILGDIALALFFLADISNKSYYIELINNNKSLAHEPTLDSFDVHQELEGLARQTQGFSGREIHKLFLSIRGAVHSSYDNCLTKDIWKKVVTWKIQEFNRKRAITTTSQKGSTSRLEGIIKSDALAIIGYDNDMYEVRWSTARGSEDFWCHREELMLHHSDAIENYEKLRSCNNFSL